MGARPEARNWEGETALIVSLIAIVARNRIEKQYIEAVSALIQLHADVNAREETNDRSALMYAACRGLSHEIVALLIGARADVNAQTKQNGRTVLMYGIVDGGSPEIVTLLIEAGADVNIKDRTGETALTLAVDSVKHMAGYPRLRREALRIIKVLLNA